MKTLFFLKALLFSSIYCFAQDSSEVQVRNITKVNFYDPGISYEARLGPKHTLYSHIYSRSFYFALTEALGASSSFQFNPGITEQFRYYYNGAKRAARRKNTEMNSMNYFGLKGQAILFRAEKIKNSLQTLDRDFYYTGASWGIQRNGDKRLSFDLQVGGGYYIINERVKDANSITVSKSTLNGFAPHVDFSLGFWLNKRK